LKQIQFACVSFEGVDDAEIFVYILWLYSNYTANETGCDALRPVSCDVSALQYASSLVSDVVSKSWHDRTSTHFGAAAAVSSLGNLPTDCQALCHLLIKRSRQESGFRRKILGGFKQSLVGIT
jgi:hypothetical protein